MRRVSIRSWLLRVVAAIGILAALALSPGFGPARGLVGVHAAGGLGFGPTTVVDDQRVAGEPDVRVCGPDFANGSFSGWSNSNCGLDNPYLSAPYGFSTTSSFVWRSEDQGKTFKLTPSNNTTGKPDACPGGGDTDLGVDPGTSQATDYLNFEDLQGLTNFSSGVSSNGGQSFTCNPVSADATAVDRQWFGFEDNPGRAPANHSRVYLDYDIAAGPTCTGQAGAAGNEFVVQTSTDGGTTFSPFVVVDCNDGIAGNMAVNEATDHVFAIHTAYRDPTNPTSTDAVVVNKSVNHGVTWTKSVVFSCPATAECTTGQDFAVLTIDKAGTLYATWSQAPVDATGSITGPSHIYYAYSTNDAVSWSSEKRIDAGVTDVNVFPWIAAGNAGKIDIVWYGTTKASGVSSYDSGSQTTDWYPYMTQSLNANSSAASFSAPIRVAQHANHNGGICTMGLGCTTGGDRSLADFFQVSINKSGGADVTWADTSNNGSNGSNQGALIDEARQTIGPTMYGGTLNVSQITCSAVTSTPCQTDQKGDARYEANMVIGANAPKLDITGSSVNIDPTNHSRLDVRLNVANLSSLPTLTDTGVMDPFLDYMTSWNYHIPGNTQTNYDSTGNIYYAYLEVNAATGTVGMAEDGNTCSIGTTHPKYLVYPGQHAISYTINNAAGTIDLYVPLTDVGNPATGATLYSVTAHTVGQAAANVPFSCSTRDPNGVNQDPNGRIFNVYDKTRAYTSPLK
ncbi:MAG: sialidase family protein [Chloroflexota bacterium]